MIPMTVMDDLRTFADSAEGDSGVRELPGAAVQSFDLDRGLLLVVPAGAKPDRDAVDRAVQVLRDTPTLAAVIDLPL